MKGYVPQGAQMTFHPNGEFLDIWDPLRRKTVRYTTTPVDYSTSSDVDVDEEVGRDGKEKVYDVIITGEVRPFLLCRLAPHLHYTFRVTPLGGNSNYMAGFVLVTGFFASGKNTLTMIEAAGFTAATSWATSTAMWSAAGEIPSLKSNLRVTKDAS
jgi:hypothetical protein